MPPRFDDAVPTELAGPPLDLVVCQIRFPTILALTGDTSTPEGFQHRINKTYPLAKMRRGAVHVQTQQSSAVVPAATDWQFDDMEEQWTVTLSPNFLALEARQYRSFNDFVGRFADILGHAQEVFPITVQTRLGLRYIDRISRTRFPNLPSDFVDLIRPELLPLRSRRGASEPAKSTVETRFAFENRVLTMRCIQSDEGFPGSDGDELVLDFDCFSEQTQSIDSVDAELRAFKKTCYNAFRWAMDRLHDRFPAAPEQAEAKE